jgi:hypothetical protein
VKRAGVIYCAAVILENWLRQDFWPPGGSIPLPSTMMEERNVTFREIEDLVEIDRCNRVLRDTLVRMSISNMQNVINPIAEPNTNTVYRFNSGLWWSYREHRRTPKSLLQYNNLFGYGEPGPRSEIEVNLPLEKFRRGPQGAYIYKPNEPNSFLLAHRGGVQHGRQPFSVLDAMEERGATLMPVVGNDRRHRRLIRVCSVTSLHLQDIIDFVRNIIAVKNSLN